jgi:hypothetical protein
MGAVEHGRVQRARAGSSGPVKTKKSPPEQVGYKSEERQTPLRGRGIPSVERLASNQVSAPLTCLTVSNPVADCSIGGSRLRGLRDA